MQPWSGHSAIWYFFLSPSIMWALLIKGFLSGWRRIPCFKLSGTWDNWSCSAVITLNQMAWIHLHLFSLSTKEASYTGQVLLLHLFLQVLPFGPWPVIGPGPHTAHKVHSASPRTTGVEFSLVLESIGSQHVTLSPGLRAVYCPCTRHLHVNCNVRWVTFVSLVLSLH